jgi:uncharacterized membrane protein (DUF4010 family)
MQDWLRMIHGVNPTFPVLPVSVKVALALAVGLFVGLEREWSNKDIGVRTFAMTALLGLLATLLGPPLLLFGGLAILILITFANLYSLQTGRKLEATTSIALALVFLFGVLVGEGHIFTPVACAIAVTMLLSLKPQLSAFAGGLRPEEVRSAVFLGLLGFVIWPLLPDRFVDPWQLLQPRQDWITVVVIACLGFVNYVLLRVYGSKGIYFTAILGGLVNSTATAAELTATLSRANLEGLAVPVMLLTSVAMFFRNLLILAIFARSAVRTAALPLIAMTLVAAFWVYRDRRRALEVDQSVTIDLGSPVSLKKVSRFAFLFIGLQVVATLGQRWIGNSGFQIVSVLGGLFSSASTTAAAADMLLRGHVTQTQAGVAVVLTSISSALTNLPLAQRLPKLRPQMRELLVSSALQFGVGIAFLVVQINLPAR